MKNTLPPLKKLRKQIGKFRKDFLYHWTHDVWFDSGGIHDAVFVAGIGRSGTTWLAELLNYRNDYRIVFEPFNPNKPPYHANWLDVQYVSPSNKDADRIRLAHSIVSGEFRSDPINKHNYRHIASARIIKEVRANLCLKWLKQQFPDLPLLLLIRHPCAVARSMLETAKRYNYIWDMGDLKGYIQQKDLIEDHFPLQSSLWKDVKDPFEVLLHAWCIQTLVPLRQLDAADAFVIYYEELVDSPEAILAKTMEYLKMPLNPEMVQASRRPSVQAREHSAINRGESLVQAWMSYISIEQQEKAQSILKLYGLDILYTPDGMPSLNAAELLPLFKQGQ